MDSPIRAENPETATNPKQNKMVVESETRLATVESVGLPPPASSGTVDASSPLMVVKESGLNSPAYIDAPLDPMPSQALRMSDDTVSPKADVEIKADLMSPPHDIRPAPMV